MELRPNVFIGDKVRIRAGRYSYIGDVIRVSLDRVTIRTVDSRADECTISATFERVELLGQPSLIVEG